MASPSCPDRPQLQALLRNTLPEAEHADLQRHLDECEDCQQTLQTLAGGDTVLPAKPSTGGPRPTDSAQLREVMERLQAMTLNRSVEPSSEADRRALDGLGFLEPSEHPGYLGRLATFDVLELVGRGGMGVVLKAQDPTLNRVVAIKVLSPQLASHENSRRRFVREAQAAAAITHDHVVTIHSVGEVDGFPYLVMEYVAGTTLAQHIAKHAPLEAAELIQIGIQMALALAAAHSYGLIHRDIKPSNVLLEQDTHRVKLSDFGLAKAVDDVSLTQTGVIIGTPEYMAPEQARGQRVDQRADLYSLGLVLYVAGTGNSPFRSDSTIQTIGKICNDTPPAIRELNPDIPAGLAKIIERLMAKEPSARYQLAEQVAELLQKQHDGVSHPPADEKSGCVVDSAGLAKTQTLTEQPGSQPPRRNRRYLTWLVAIAGVLVLAIIGLVRRPLSSGFVLLDSNRTCETLAEAIQMAEDGAVIQVLGNGPFPTSPIQIDGKAITIRAADGFHPILTVPVPGQPSDQPLLTSNAKLVLEGIEINWAITPSMDPPAISEFFRRCAVMIYKGSLHASNCKFVAGNQTGCVGGIGSVCHVRNCHFVAATGMCVGWQPTAADHIELENSILDGRGALALFVAGSLEESDPCTVRLIHNTMQARRAVHFFVSAGRRGFADFVVEKNIFDVDNLCVVSASRMRRRSADFGVNMPSFISWNEKENVYARSVSFFAHTLVRRAAKPETAGPRNLGEWNEFWRQEKTGSIQGDVVYRSRIQQSDASQFHVRQVRGTTQPVPASVGPNVDMVGPGKAYQSWKETPAYQQWLDRIAQGLQ